jgi:hypothetical protein
VLRNIWKTIKRMKAEVKLLCASLRTPRGRTRDWISAPDVLNLDNISAWKHHPSGTLARDRNKWRKLGESLPGSHSRCGRGGAARNLATCNTLASFSVDFRPWRWKLYVPEEQFTYRLHGATSQKMATSCNRSIVGSRRLTIRLIGYLLVLQIQSAAS